jgi:hypothetical protein
MRRAVPLAVVLFCLCGLAVFPEVSAGASSTRRLAESEVAFAEGLAALEAGRDQEAADWFAEAARLDPDADPERALASRPVDDRGLWEGIAGLSLASDSNPNLLSNELILPRLGKQGVLVRGEERDAKARPAVSLGIYPFHARPGLNLGLSLGVRRSFHDDFGFLDLGEAHGAVQLAFGSAPLGFLEGPLGGMRVPFGDSRFSALLQAGGAGYRVDGDSYLRTWGGAASLTFHELPATATRLDFDWTDREFSRGALADERRSGKDLSLQASQLFFWGRRDRYLRIGALAVDRRAGRPFEESIREGNAELALPLALRWTVHLEGSVRKDDFDHPESNLFDLVGPVRNDTTRRAALTLLWEATDRLRLTARGTYVDRNSNVDLGQGLPDLDYQRSIASVGVSWVF